MGNQELPKTLKKVLSFDYSFKGGNRMTSD